MIAALPMYDPPSLRSANDRLWSRLARALRDRGIIDVPDALKRTGEIEDIWTSPALLLAQTCGYPLTTDLRETVQLVATPHYDAEGCEGPVHRSAIIVRQDSPARSLADLRGVRAGLNGHNSNSGMNLFRAAIAPIAGGAPFFASVLTTGSHARSVAAVLSKRVDVAAIDAVTLRLLRDQYPRHTTGIRVLDWTAPSPGLPLITSRLTSGPLLLALREELARLTNDAALLAPLRITGFSTVALEDYRVILDREDMANASGYPVLV